MIVSIAICDMPTGILIVCTCVYSQYIDVISILFVSLCTDGTVTLVSYDKRFRDFWGYVLISRLSHLMFLL